MPYIFLSEPEKLVSFRVMQFSYSTDECKLEIIEKNKTAKKRSPDALSLLWRKGVSRFPHEPQKAWFYMRNRAHVEIEICL